MLNFGYIYKTTNLINGRLYVGQKQGTFTHKYLGSGKILRQAISKYGKENFRLEVLAFASTEAMLDGLEKKYIYEYRQVFGKEFLYNINDGGDGASSENIKNLWKQKEYREHMEAVHKGQKGYWTGKKLSKEHAAKTRIAHKGKPSWNKGVPMREETKNKFRTKEHSQKVSKAITEWHAKRKQKLMESTNAK